MMCFCVLFLEGHQSYGMRPPGSPHFNLHYVFKAQSRSEILEVGALPWLCLNLSPNSRDRPRGQVAEGGLGIAAYGPW